MVVEGQRLWLAAWEADLPDHDWPQLTPGALLDLDIPGELDLGSGWKLRGWNRGRHPRRSRPSPK